MTLTEEGRKVALGVVRRHRLVELYPPVRKEARRVAAEAVAEAAPAMDGIDLKTPRVLCSSGQTNQEDLRTTILVVAFHPAAV